MTRMDAMVESPTGNKRQPLLSDNPAMGRDGKEVGNRRKIGEFAGGTTAECAVVCCCCPCALMHLLILALYRVPAGLCKKAMKKNRRRKLQRKKKKNLLEEDQRTTTNGPDAVKYRDESDGEDDGHDDYHNLKGVGVMEAVDLDSEMWGRFYGAGFWRSNSRRED